MDTRKTADRLKNAVRRLNFALSIVKKSKLESLSGLCEACERDEGGAPDRCSVTGDEWHASLTVTRPRLITEME